MKKKKMYYGIPVILLAMIMIGFLATEPVNSLRMDVNPSIELVTSRLNRVVEINPMNQDAVELLKDFKAKDKDLENTINDLLDLMVLTGHIKGGEDNFVMLTVEDDSMDSKYVDKVNQAIAAILENKKIEATVLNQSITKSQKKSNKTGLELAAGRLQEIDDDISLEKIEKMTVKEFINYSRSKDIAIEDLFKIVEDNRKKEYEVDKDDDYKEEKPTSPKKKISVDAAKKIAMDKVGGGKITEFELDDYEYEIEIEYNGKEYDLEIDIYTGEIKEYKVDKDDDYKEEKPTNPSKKKISVDAAKKIAMDKVGGGKITEFELDDYEYEIEIEYNGKEYELEIDIYTGEILDFEVEDMDD